MAVVKVIQDELRDINTHCETLVPGSKVITCVPCMVQVNIMKTKYKQITVCVQFPEGYPEFPLIIELKSKTLSDKFLYGLTKFCDKECEKLIGTPQVLKVLKFLRFFIEDNPLCVCSEEIASLKRELSDCDEIKLKQKTSSIYLHITQGVYYLKVKCFIPDSYPEEQIRTEIKQCNFPKNFQLWFQGQCTEIARQCVKKPLKPKPKDPPFQPKPSLWPCLKFLIDETKRYPTELCQLCKEKCFPDKPEESICKENDNEPVERVYCGHIFHNDCLNTYMKTPPFHDGKKCPKCKQRIYHEKWKITPKLAEDRWAHKEAKTRELGEVVEFFE